MVVGLAVCRCTSTIACSYSCKWDATQSKFSLPGCPDQVEHVCSTYIVPTTRALCLVKSRKVTNHDMVAVIAGRKNVPEVRPQHWDGHRWRACCLCWTWQGAQTPLFHDIGQEQASLAGRYPGGLRERHGGLASLPGPCRPLGRLRC